MSGMNLHVAIIMDGNGRWAERRGLSRSSGHRAGAKAVRRIVESAAGSEDIAVLTLYAFSSDNWKRPATEVSTLMRLFERYLLSEQHRCVENDIRVNVIGRRNRLEPRLVRAIETLEALTVNGKRLHLRLAVDYSARATIIEAARCLRADEANPLEVFPHLLNRVSHSASDTVDVDLLIRTGGEKRLSDFMLWECAYAEFVFSDRLWPDFNADDLHSALALFKSRERRYGALPPGPQALPVPESL